MAMKQARKLVRGDILALGVGFDFTVLGVEEVSDHGALKIKADVGEGSIYFWPEERVPVIEEQAS